MQDLLRVIAVCSRCTHAYSMVAAAGINAALYAAVNCCTINYSKGIHLSEDIFAGFNWVLRGGRSSQLDYIQAGKVSQQLHLHFVAYLHSLAHEAQLYLSMYCSVSSS
jgi:hypothetical protein